MIKFLLWVPICKERPCRKQAQQRSVRIPTSSPMRKFMRRLKISIASTALLLASCAADEHPDLRAFVANSDDSLRGHVTGVAQAKQPDTVIYQAFAQADPFSAKRMRPPEVLTGGSTWAPPGQREALEAYPLDALHMVGTVERDGKRWALVKTPDNSVHRVARGNRVGEPRTRFRVTSIVSAP